MKQAALDLWHLTDNKKGTPSLHSLTRVWASITGDAQETVTKLLETVMWKKRLGPVIYNPNENELKVIHDSPMDEHFYIGAKRRDSLKSATNESSSCLINMSKLFEVLEEQGVSYPPELIKPKRKNMSNNRPSSETTQIRSKFCQLAVEVNNLLWTKPESEIFKRMTEPQRLQEIKANLLTKKTIKKEGGTKVVYYIKGTELEVGVRKLGSVYQVALPDNGIPKGIKPPKTPTNTKSK